MKSWIKSHKIATGIVAFVVLILIIAAGGGDKSKTKQESTTTPAQTQTPKQEAVTQKPAEPVVPKYNLVGEYGQGGKAYVIAPSDATEDKLTLIGKDLYKRFGSETFARIGIYTDKAQAQIIVDDPLTAANLEGAAADAYDKAYVAQFNINKNSGLKQFVIFPMGQNKEIKL